MPGGLEIFDAQGVLGEEGLVAFACDQVDDGRFGELVTRVDFDAVHREAQYDIAADVRTVNGVAHDKPDGLQTFGDVFDLVVFKIDRRYPTKTG